MEVMFQIELDVLRTLSPKIVDGSEASFLVAFDLNRAAIFQVARIAYQRKRGSYYRLSATNFS